MNYSLPCKWKEEEGGEKTKQAQLGGKVLSTLCSLNHTVGYALVCKLHCDTSAVLLQPFLLLPSVVNSSYKLICFKFYLPPFIFFAVQHFLCFHAWRFSWKNVRFNAQEFTIFSLPLSVFFSAFIKNLLFYKWKLILNAFWSFIKIPRHLLLYVPLRSYN